MEDLKLEAQRYIKNNSKYYKNYLESRKIKPVILNAMKILERKLLNINAFCYYINYACAKVDANISLYLKLTPLERKQLNFYQNSFIKIGMHLDLIFTEIEKIKKY